MRSASSAARGGEKRREAAALNTTQGTTCNMLPKRGPPNNNNNNNDNRQQQQQQSSNNKRNAGRLCALPRPLPQSLPTSQPASRCHRLATRRQTGRSRCRAQYAHKAFSPVACSTACRRATPTRRAATATTITRPLAYKMDDADDAQCMRASECARRLPRRVQQGWQHAGRVKCDECAIILLYCVVSGRVALFNGISHINLRSTPNGPTNQLACAEVDNDVDSSVGSDCVPALSRSRSRHRRRSYVSTTRWFCSSVESYFVFCRLHRMWGKIADKMTINLFIMMACYCKNWM